MYALKGENYKDGKKDFEMEANMNLLEKDSIILKIGDLKLSDTHDTFGEKKEINGYQYIPLEDPSGSWSSQVIDLLAHGDAKEGVLIRNQDTEILLTYGANRVASNAQSMAIGYYNGGEYYFMDECYRDIYSEHPIVTSRNFVKCHSLWSQTEGDTCKALFSIYNPNLKVRLTKAEKQIILELVSRIKRIEQGLTKESLSNLRKKEIFLRKREEAKRLQQREEDDGR